MDRTALPHRSHPFRFAALTVRVGMTAAAILIVAILISCKSAAPAPRPLPAAALADEAGDSVEAAVPVPADAPNGGVDFENNWIFYRYGRFRRNAGGTGTLNGRRYDVVKIELPNGDKKTVYFDITENWAHWSPP